MPFFYCLTFINRLTMKGQVTIFESAQFGQIRTSVSVQDEPLFCLADICKAINVINHRNVAKRIDQDGVRRMDIIDSMGRNQQVLFVTEPGMYEVLLRSDSEKAKPFRKWVCGEVLPSIRKSGGYMVATDDETPEQIMARALLVAQQTIERSKQQLQMAHGTIEQQQEQLAVMKPKADYVDEVLQSTATYTFTQIAHSLGFRSVHVLTKELANRKLIFKQSGMWQPTARVADKGYFTTRTAKFIHSSDNSIGTSLSTVITEAGRMFIHSIFSQEKGGAR